MHEGDTIALRAEIPAYCSMGATVKRIIESTPIAVITIQIIFCVRPRLITFLHMIGILFPLYALT